ncbi:16S rRNA (uracil(1498)-N(3))-methyltransferase [uncultured Methylophaga sp.]|uniref:16S rRNA (uracil(1498)-N(3))-methyltransferase n=1 Tax=uncultured Methylophaga sp. TaxID=285271 RepID=UPI00261E0BB1|nr:16S rRNA (uracil(1498)-N(3))-methyltransferase [uncultured Methylophaga sp.]
MRIPRFYCPQLGQSQTVMALPESVHRHAVQVLRLKAGAPVRLFDGQGRELEATLSLVERKRSEVQLDRELDIQSESPLDITLLQGISRGERMDFAIQKAVELGVKTIMPVVTERCNVQLSKERAEKRLKHWQGVLTSACEQSGRAYMPELSPVTTLDEAMTVTADDLKLVLDPQAQQRFHSLPQPQTLTLLIGPEGGLSDDEISQAQQADFTAVQFGPRILRTETAAVAALAVVQTLWGDLG